MREREGRKEMWRKIERKRKWGGKKGGRGDPYIVINQV